MNIGKKLVIAGVFLLATTAFSVMSLVNDRGNDGEGNPANADMVLYYKIGCPHCEIVEKYIQEKGLTQKLSLTEKEVSGNKEVQNEFINRSKACNLDMNNLGVPMMWDNKGAKCYVGDKDIINFLDNQIYQFNQ